MVRAPPFPIRGGSLLQFRQALRRVAGAGDHNISSTHTLGVQLFGGTVYDGNPALEGTDYMEEGYDILNNNDYAMAFMSLFTFITAGPYHEFIEAAEAAIPVVGYLYHVSFYVRG